MKNGDSLPRGDEAYHLSPTARFNTDYPLYDGQETIERGLSSTRWPRLPFELGLQTHYLTSSSIDFISRSLLDVDFFLHFASK